MKKRNLISALVLSALVLGLFAGCEGHTHKFSKWETEEEATCEEEGKKVRTCDCGEKQSKSIPQLEHEYESSVTKEAVCLQAGEKTYKCKLCEDSYTEVIPQLEHEYEITQTQDLSCTQDGVTTSTCKKCGDVKTDTTASTGHNYEESVTKEASCQGNGEKTFSCTACQDSYTEEIVFPKYSATELYEMYDHSVGEVHTYDKNGNGVALGTCFVYTADGQLITNYHVIEGAYSAEVIIAGTTYPVQQVLSYDITIDVAILKIEATELKAAVLCKKTHQVGKPVYALGSSQGLTSTMSDGMITYADRESGGVHYVQHDAPISSGNSGGPLINEYGEVIGINTMILLDSQNINFAIALTELDNLDFSTPMTMAELYEKESDPYKKLIRLAEQEGLYDSESGTYTWVFDVDYSDDNTTTWYSCVMYYPEEEIVILGVLAENASYTDIFGIKIDASVSGTYEWAYTDQIYNITGTISYSFQDGDQLSYSEYDMPDSDRSTYLGWASDYAGYLLITINYAQIGVTTADLGFTYF